MDWFSSYRDKTLKRNGSLSPNLALLSSPRSSGLEATRSPSNCPLCAKRAGPEHLCQTCLLWTRIITIRMGSHPKLGIRGCLHSWEGRASFRCKPANVLSFSTKTYPGQFDFMCFAMKVLTCSLGEKPNHLRYKPVELWYLAEVHTWPPDLRSPACPRRIPAHYTQAPSLEIHE